MMFTLQRKRDCFWHIIMSLLCRAVMVSRQSSRHLSLTPAVFKEIRHTETDKKIVVEGVMPRTEANTAVKCCGGGQHECHPFCKSPIVDKVKHTDVLILDQFLDSKGEMYSKEDLKICNVSERCTFTFTFYMNVNFLCLP